ncbi:response regulator transcription factor [Actinoplanes sp. NPDC049599]|uniref:response regulator transcription factor n=1 Tax=Actinoplanes sp. NPDC049599 TaxID=3363903 RepID=UPI0037985B27
MSGSLTNGEIAQGFTLSESTVKTHVGRVLAKIGARDRIQAVILAYNLRLTRPVQPVISRVRRGRDRSTGRSAAGSACSHTT